MPRIIQASLIFAVSLASVDANAAPLRYCGEDGVSCLSRVVNREQLAKVSKSFSSDSAPLLKAVAQAARKPVEDVDSVWEIVIGPPRAKVIVAALAEGSFVPFLVNENVGKLTRLSFSPPLGLVHRRDVRSAAPVDVLGDGGRQLLLAGDTLGGSGVGQASVFIYRLKGNVLECILDGELDSDSSIGPPGDSDVYEMNSTSYTWNPRPGAPAGIVATSTRTLGRLKSTRKLRIEWNGSQFAVVETPADRALQQKEEDRFDAEIRRIQRAQHAE
jgi:hypothetical protein